MWRGGMVDEPGAVLGGDETERRIDHGVHDHGAGEPGQDYQQRVEER